MGYDWPIKNCGNCGTTNRIAPHALSLKPICGVCHADLPDPFRAFGTDTFLQDHPVPMERLPFQLLPPDKTTVANILAYYQLGTQYRPPSLQGQKVDPARLWHIMRLNPLRCYVGTELWLGYVIFEFSYTTKVVLECPVEGNAIYILPATWRKMIHLSKQSIRANRRQWRKIVHKGDWFNRLQQALSAS